MELISTIASQMFFLILGAFLSYFISKKLGDKRFSNNLRKANNELNDYIKNTLDFDGVEDKRAELCKKYRIDLDIIDSPKIAVSKIMNSAPPLLKLDYMNVSKAWEVYAEAAAWAAKANDNKNALNFYEKAINSFPWINKDMNHIGKLYILRGGILKRLQQYTVAIESLEKGLELVDDAALKADAYYNLACIFGAMNDNIKYKNVIRNLDILDDAIKENALERIERWLRTYGAFLF